MRLQKAFAKLEDRGVSSVENCSLYLGPRSLTGAPMILKDEKGKEQDIIEITCPCRSGFRRPPQLEAGFRRCGKGQSAIFSALPLTVKTSVPILPCNPFT